MHDIDDAVVPRQVVDPRDADHPVVDLDACVRALHGLGGAGHATILESRTGDASGDAGIGGWSYVCLATGPRLLDDGRHVRRVDGEAGVAVAPGDPGRVIGQDPFAVIDAFCDRHGLTPDAEAGLGGLVGVLSYDLGRRVEDFAHDGARRDRPLPWMDLVVSEVLLAISPDRRRARLVGRPITSDTESVRLLVGRAANRLAVAARRDDDRIRGRSPRTHRPDTEWRRPRRTAIRSTMDADAHGAGVRAVLDHIAAGDTFQVNLAQRLTGHWDGNGWDLYRALRDVSPAEFGALATLGDAAVASISPETFLVSGLVSGGAGRRDGRDVTTRPIKGTRPRAADPERDRANRDALAASVKDRAENVMVVDMERNDLGRVCEPGTVRVPELLAVEQHPTVWHLVSTVTGRLQDGVGWGALLRATFPCGSITGTPKVRAMEVIDRLEPVRRGAYCGAIGYLAAGSVNLSVAIRTATLHGDGTVDYGAGGGIVADSDPAEEYDETMDKAAAFLHAIGAHPTQEAPA